MNSAQGRAFAECNRDPNTTSTPLLRYDSQVAVALFSGGDEGIETDNRIRDPVPVHCPGRPETVSRAGRACCIGSHGNFRVDRRITSASAESTEVCVSRAK